MSVHRNPPVSGSKADQAGRGSVRGSWSNSPSRGSVVDGSRPVSRVDVVPGSAAQTTSAPEDAVGGDGVLMSRASGAALGGEGVLASRPGTTTATSATAATTTSPTATASLRRRLPAALTPIVLASARRAAPSALPLPQPCQSAGSNRTRTQALQWCTRRVATGSPERAHSKADLMTASVDPWDTEPGIERAKTQVGKRMTHAAPEPAELTSPRWSRTRQPMG